jgi:DNA-binding transcriptional ArsR family regulator
METNDVVTALAALAHESRLAVFRLLVKRGPNGFTPGELTEKLEIPAPTLSFHLKELQRAGLVSSRREGRFLYYSANYQQMNELLGFLTENCCSLAESTCAASCESADKPKAKRA